MRAVRAVLDTNVVISAALIADSVPFAVLTQVLDNGVLIFSSETFEEVTIRLLQPKFDRYVSQDLRHRLLTDLAAMSEWTTITGALRVCRDRSDDKIIETALAGGAKYLVTGDRDLLDLNSYRDVNILTPRDCLAHVEGTGTKT